MDLTLQKISYKQLREQKYAIADDRYGIIAFVNEKVRNCLLSCPNNTDDHNTAINLIIADGIAVGRNILFTTRFMAENKTFLAQTGGSVEVYNDYRRRGIASMILRRNHDAHDIYLGALYSEGALCIYKKMGDSIIESPLLLKPHNMDFYLRAKKIRGKKGKILKFLMNNVVLRGLYLPTSIKEWMLKKKFSVEQVRQVPEWVGELACNDGHKYREQHDTSWLQWCLDNNMSENPKDRQQFYIVKEKKGDIRGFFMTKVRYDEHLGPYDSIISGSVMEWGATDESILSETSLNLLAEDTFGTEITHIITVASSKETLKKLKQWGYLSRGSFQMSFNDIQNRFPDVHDRNLWRIRFGCCNTVILRTSR